MAQGARAKLNCSVDVDRSPEDVFGYVSDVSRHGEWSPKPYRVEGLNPGPVTVGTTFTSYGWIPGDKDHAEQVEVLEVDAPKRLVLRSKEKDDFFINTFTVTSTDAGARLEREIDMPKPGGFVGMIFPLVLSGFIKPAVQKGMKMFKTKLESQPAS